MPLVESLRVAVYRIPLDEPESDGTLTWDHTSVVLVEAWAAGRKGIGFTYGSPACAAFIRSALLPVVQGTDVDDVGGSWWSMVKAIRNDGRPGISSMSIAAVDTALWDLKAKLLDLPLCRVLGMVHPDVAVYGSGGFTSLSEQQLCEQLGGWVHRDGIPRVKMKIATSWGGQEQRDLERVVAARRAIGDGAELFVDANGGYTRKQAVRLGLELCNLGVSWFEEPVSSDDLTGLNEIRGVLRCDVAAGEYGYDVGYFERMCTAGAIDVMQADVTRCAGITEWRRVAAVAAAHGLQISGHCAPALHLHVACSVPNIRHLEYFADHVRAEHLLFDGVPVPKDGRLAPDLSRPGHGLELNASSAAQFHVEE